MAAVVSLHIADVGVGAGLGLLINRLAPGGVRGLRHVDVGAAAALSPSFRPKPTLGRIGLIGFWDDDRALERFVAEDRIAERFRGGWQARLEPLRRYGSWPGLDENISEARHTSYDGPTVVLTLGRLRLTQARRFLRASAKAEEAAIAAPGLVWATGLARPPFVCTCSVWESARMAAAYAYGSADRGHPDAIDADAAKPFHKQSAFVRFRPYHVEGLLSGPNPLCEGAVVLPPLGRPAFDRTVAGREDLL